MSRTNLSARTVFQTLEPRQLFAGFASDLVAPTSAPRLDPSLVVTPDVSNPVAAAFVGTWKGTFVTADKQTMTLVLRVKEVTGLGDVAAQVSLTNEIGKELTADATGTFYKRGFTLAFEQGKTFFGRISGRVFPGKAVEATLDLSVDATRLSAAATLTLDQPASASTSRGDRQPAPGAGKVAPQPGAERIDPAAVFNDSRVIG
jgi:hypothetical protein